MSIDLAIIANKMQEYFGKDQKRIEHAFLVADYAEKILKQEDADRDVVIASSYLHDIGIHEAEKKYNSTAGKYQEIEGPPIAKKILEGLGLETDFINSVCGIISKHHTLNGLDTKEFQILYEADWIVNLGCDFKDVNKDKKKDIIDKNFKTKTGRKIAYEAYIS